MEEPLEQREPLPSLAQERRAGAVQDAGDGGGGRGSWPEIELSVHPASAPATDVSRDHGL